MKQCRNFFGIIVLQFVDPLSNGSMVGFMTNSTKRTFATCHASQDWWFQCRCLHNKPLLTHASTGDPQTLTGSLESVSCGGHDSFSGFWCTQGSVCAFQESLAGMKFGFKSDCANPTILLWILLCPWKWSIFSWWVTTSSDG